MLLLFLNVLEKLKKRQEKKVVHVFLYAFYMTCLFFSIEGSLEAKNYNIIEYQNSIIGPIHKSQVKERFNYGEYNPSSEISLMLSDFISSDGTDTCFQNDLSDEFIETIAGPINKDFFQNLELYNIDLIYGILDASLSNSGQMTPGFIQKQINFHLKEARATYRKANEMCALVPTEKRKIAYELFQTTVEASAGMAYAGYPGLISVLIYNLAKYGVFVCEQCYQIREALNDCEYHYHMVVYYLNKKDELGYN